LDLIKKSDEKNGKDINDSDSVFNKISQKLISINPSFQKNIDNYRKNVNTENNLSGENILNRERVKSSFSE
jgi:hypothetical protein